MDPSWLFTLPYDDILAQFPDADPSTVSAKVTAGGGGTSSASVKLSVSANDGAITSSATTVVEAEDTKVVTTATAEAAGETASTLLDLETGIEEQDGQIVAETWATAQAEAEAAEGDTATATATTDAAATGFDTVAVIQTPSDGEATEDGWAQSGEHPVAKSSTELTAAGVEDVEVDALELSLEDEELPGFWILDLS